MTFEIKRRVMYTFKFGDKVEELDTDQLRLKVTEAWSRIRVLQSEISVREKAMHECEAFVRNAEGVLNADSEKKTKVSRVETVRHGISKEKVEKLLAIINASPNRQWSFKDLTKETGYGEANIRSGLRYLRSLRLVNESWDKVPNRVGGKSMRLLVKSKPKPAPVPQKPQIPTVEHSVNQDLSAIEEEEKKRRIAMREN